MSVTIVEEGNHKRVASLRKGGKLAEAYAMALDCMARDAENISNRRAYCWVLYDMMKASNIAKNFDESVNFLEEVVDKGLADEPMLQQAISLVVLRLLKDLIKQQYDEAVVQGVIDNLYSLGNEKPSEIHSNILDVMLLSADKNPNFLAFIQNWDLKNFRREDWRGREINGKKQRCLVERAYFTIANHIGKTRNYEAAKEWMPIFEHLMTEQGKVQALYFHYIKMLVALKIEDKIEQHLLPYLQQKSSDPNAWALLAEYLIPTDPEKGIACYRKALSLKMKPDIGYFIRLNFIPHLIKINELAQAKYEINTAVAMQVQLKKDEHPLIQGYLNEEWFETTEASTESKTLYHNAQALADTFLHSSLNWVDGSLLYIETIQKSPKPSAVVIVKGQYGTETVRVPVQRFNFLQDLKSGTPLQLKLERSNGRTNVFTVENRTEGTLWDVFPECIGLIDTMNRPKDIAHFIVDKKIEGTLKISQHPIPLELGKTYAFRLNTRQKEDRTWYEILTISETNETFNSDIIRNFTAPLKRIMGKDFAFADDVFIPGELLRNLLGANDGSHITGLAVQTYDPKKEKHGWRAIRLTNND